MDNRKTFTREFISQTIDIPDCLDELEESNNLRQLAMDIKRRLFTVQGKKFPDNIYKLAVKLSNNSNNNSIKNSFKKKFSSYLKQNGFSNKNIEYFLCYYSQRPLYNARQLANLISKNDDVINFDDQYYDLFSENGKVYFFSRISKLYVRDLSDSSRHSKDFKGSVECITQLTNKGFKFVKTTTNHDISFYLNQRFINQKKINETLLLMQQAQIHGDINLFIFNLWLFQFYMKQSLLNAYRQMSWGDVFKKIKKIPIINPAMLIEARKIITEQLPGKKGESLLGLLDNGFDQTESNNIENIKNIKTELSVNLNNIPKKINKYLSLYTPINTLLEKVDDFCQTPKEVNIFKRKLCDYQIEHAVEVYDTQLKLKRKLRTKDFLKEDDLLSDKREIAFCFLRNIQHIILTTKWKVGLLKIGILAGKEVKDEYGEIHTIPFNMYNILIIINNAIKKDRNGQHDIWIEAFNKVAKLGRKAALYKSFLSMRDDSTQAFYDDFLNLFKNRYKYSKLIIPDEIKLKI